MSANMWIACLVSFWIGAVWGAVTEEVDDFVLMLIPFVITLVTVFWFAMKGLGWV